MRRFYKNVSVESAGGIFEIHLDNKPVRKPSGAFLSVSTKVLADEIAREWAAQGSDVIPDTMPVTQILITAQDVVSQNRENLQREVLGYLDTDLVCYRAPDGEPVAAAQKQAWDKWISWFETRFGVRLETTAGLAALTQPHKAHEMVESYVSALDDLRFTVLQLATGMSGSLVLALAFMEGKTDPPALHDASRVEEIFKAKIYREDVHGAAPNEEKRHAAVARDLAACRRILDLLS